MNFFELDSNGLNEWMINHGIEKYRTKQLLSWVWDKGVFDPAQMTNIPESDRNQFREIFSNLPFVAKAVRSRDTSRKVLVQYSDGKQVEMVLMKSVGHLTLCVSTQVGCAFSCLFCESGKDGLERNLTAGEIVAQIALCNPRPRNIVFMGIGEPLANWDNFLKAVRRLNTEAGISMRHMTVSTVGLPGKIMMVGKELPQIKLAISLHAPKQAIRERIMPRAAKTLKLKDLMDDVRDYVALTKNRITFEYVLISKVNDSVDDAIALSEMLGGLPCLINLIPYNESPGSEFHPSSPMMIRKFLDVLRSEGYDATVRKSLGLSENAACGQLKANEAQK
jgi:23S rRNA (adenine2503-C2)-methyltransferase